MWTSPWILAFLVLTSLAGVVLGIVLWSARSQRLVGVRVDGVEPLDPDDLSALQITRGRRSTGNRVEILQDGALFRELLAAIEGARDHVHLTVYVWWRGDLCRRFADALAARAAAGVEVRLLVDAIGAWDADGGDFAKIRAAGGRVEHYHDVRFRTVGRLNKRSHRRIAVIDGRTAFVFGHGIAAEWEGENGWRDTGVRLEGPAVADLQGIFAEQWAEESAEVLAAGRYYSPSEDAGDVLLETVASSPRGGISNLSVYLQMRIAAAREEVWIQTPYFIPGPRFRRLLGEVLERGVRIHVMVPGPEIDWQVARWAARRTFPELLAAGMRVWELRGRMMHQKVIVVDRRWAFVGTANLDDRSLDINAEVGVGLWSEPLAAQLVETFERDREACGPIDAEHLARLPGWVRARDAAAYWLHDQI